MPGARFQRAGLRAQPRGGLTVLIGHGATGTQSGVGAPSPSQAASGAVNQPKHSAGPPWAWGGGGGMLGILYAQREDTQPSYQSARGRKSTFCPEMLSGSVIIQSQPHGHTFYECSVQLSPQVLIYSGTNVRKTAMDLSQARVPVEAVCLDFKRSSTASPLPSGRGITSFLSPNTEACSDLVKAGADSWPT